MKNTISNVLTNVIVVINLIITIFMLNYIGKIETMVDDTNRISDKTNHDLEQFVDYIHSYDITIEN